MAYSLMKIVKVNRGWSVDTGLQDACDSQVYDSGNREQYNFFVLLSAMDSFVFLNNLFALTRVCYYT